MGSGVSNVYGVQQQQAMVKACHDLYFGVIKTKLQLVFDIFHTLIVTIDDYRDYAANAS